MEAQANVLKTYSRRTQDVLKTYSRRTQDVLKTFFSSVSLQFASFWEWDILVGTILRVSSFALVASWFGALGDHLQPVLVHLYD